MHMAERYLSRLLILVAFTLSVLAMGVAHRIPSPDDLAAESFVLAGGDLAEICGDAGTDGTHAGRDCPACQLVGSIDAVPVTVALREADLVLVAKVVAPRESRAVRVVLDLSHGLRAPPLA